jgi:hypothetical protein
MRAFSVSSEYISDLIAGLNLTLVTAMSASAPNLAPASASNATTLPSTTSEFYNTARAIPAFSVTVKPTFIKYLEETRKNSIKRVS